MAGDESSRFAAVCFIASFLWLLHSLDRHSLIDQPRFSAFLVLLVSGAVAFVLSIFSKQLPGADGRFDSEAVFNGLKSSLPQRPRRYYVPCIIILIVIRLEILYRVVHDFQCTVQGVEAFLPVILLAYDIFFNRKAAAVIDPDELEDPWGSVWDDFANWFTTSQLPLFFITLILCYGVFLGADFAPRSSYFCSKASDQISWIILLQWVGVFLDAAILFLLWRVLSWAKTTKSRLQKLSGVLTSSSLAAGFMWLLARFFQFRSVASGQSFLGIDSIFVFDILTSGITCAVIAASATLWMCESTPLPLTATTIFLCGTVSAFNEILLFGTYQQTSRLLPVTVLSVVSISFSFFTYSAGMRSILYIPRILFILLLITLLITGAMISLLKKPLLNQHPLDDLIYKNRVEADRWLRHASVSTTLNLAVSEYKERHHGRDPPANFDKWFEFAMQRKSVIVDKYDQIETDILPFWGLKSSKLRENLEVVKALPDIGIIKVAEGKASHNQPAESEYKLVFDEAVSMISSFAQHLVDMEIPINLRERPRVLVPWDDVHRLAEKGSKPRSKLEKVLPQALTKRDVEVEGSKVVKVSSSEDGKVSPGLAVQSYSAQDFRHLQALACPHGSKTRASVTWNVRDHCASCANPHSQGQILQNWEYSLDPCHQPDIFNLHDFHTTPHRFDLHQSLLPLFSRSKTNSFNDILIPLIRPNVNEKVDETRFSSKQNRLYWQEVPQAQPATHDLTHGGHRNRLVHLINNATAFDKQAMLLGTKYGKDIKYTYEEVGIREINKILATEISYIHPSGPCEDPNCQLVEQEQFGFKPKEENPVASNQYLMVLDTSDGPSPDTLSILRSNSVPFISSIFREWFTERLMPWTHFVPIDVRYHGLHSTLAYFEGLKGRGKVNGRDQPLEGRAENANWIAEEGKKWVEKAMRKEDMEVYMFRLLLEWGRVMSEERDSNGFVLKEIG